MSDTGLMLDIRHSHSPDQCLVGPAFFIVQGGTAYRGDGRGAIDDLPFGVFGSYQKDWETPHLFYAEKCMGAKLWDVDGNEFVDFNFGDTPAMFGHGPENPAIKAAAERMMTDGICPMMGTEDQHDATALLADRFGLPQWMHALTASDANRYAFAIARHHTGRQNIAIPNFTYHGTIDETQKMMPEPGVISRYHDMAMYFTPVDMGTKVFNWNDLASVEEILADRTVACLVMEPVMSNFGWAWPKPEWHAGVKALCEQYGTLLLFDETHTISAGPNGMVGEMGIKGNYDFWTCGKCISSGFPGAVFGMSEEIGQKMAHDQQVVGFLAGAGLDVTDPEPLPADHVLWTMDNVIITPHVSAVGADSAKRVAAIAAENLRRYVEGGYLLNIVNMKAGY